MPGKYRSKVLRVEGTGFTLDNKLFYLQGLSFFNAIYNKAFNICRDERERWMSRFKEYGINMLRIWCQWDFDLDKKAFIDVGKDCTLYTDKGEIKENYFERLREIIMVADRLDMVIEVVLFANEKHMFSPIPMEIQSNAVRNMTESLKPFRNIILQIWNENSTGVVEHYSNIKKIDPDRIVTNSPGIASVLGDDEQNEMLDVLTPHTVRRGADRFWEKGPEQLRFLLEKFNKPVIDDEPARCGTKKFGGLLETTKPEQHIEQIKNVRKLGCYHVYHHDMFQCGYADPSIPPNGIPYPEFSDFHKKVFDYLRNNKTW